MGRTLNTLQTLALDAVCVVCTDLVTMTGLAVSCHFSEHASNCRASPVRGSCQAAACCPSCLRAALHAKPSQARRLVVCTVRDRGCLSRHYFHTTPVVVQHVPVEGTAGRQTVRHKQVVTTSACAPQLVTCELCEVFKHQAQFASVSAVLLSLAACQPA